MKLATNTRLATTMDIIFWDFLVLYQIFFSPQVKQSVIINNKHDIFELPQELPNNIPHGIFAAGGASAPTQEKKKKT